MFIAHFEYNKEEPEVMYFTASEREPESMDFKICNREPIKFKIKEDMSFGVDD